MNEMSAKNVIDMTQFSSRPDARAEGLLDQVREMSTQGLTQLVFRMLDLADDALFDMSSRADSDETQQLYFGTMRSLRLRRKDIEVALTDAMNRHFNDFLRGEPAPGAVGEFSDFDEDSLSLVDDDDVEELIAVKNMAARAENRFYQALYEITVRLGALTKREALTELAHPLNPLELGKAFGVAIASLDLNMQAKLTVLKLFEKHVMAQLGFIYSAVNQFLVGEGILPKVKRAVRKNEDGQSEDPSQALLPEDLSAAGASVARFLAFVPSSPHLLGALSDMQGFMAQEGYPAEMTPEQIGVHILNLYRQGLDPSADPSAVAADEKTINMVSTIFDYILEDRQVAAPIKVLLARLQIPMLKLALVDRSFFGMKKHPARKLLNAMAAASAGWADGSDSELDILTTKVGEVVDAVLAQFETDPAVFTVLLEDFEKFVAARDERVKIFEDRARKTVEGRERVEFAKRRTEAWVEMWAGRDNMPNFVSEFLRGPWKTTMLMTMHRHGEESPEWAARIKTVNNLLWSIIPKKTAKGGRLLVEMLPGILTELRDGMEAASAHPATMEIFFSKLAKLHAMTVNGGVERDLSARAPVAPVPTSDASFLGPEVGLAGIDVEEVTFEFDDDEIDECPEEEIVLETPASALEAELDAAGDGFDDLARELACGTWIEFQADNGVRQRGKLSWRSPLTSCCLFVDRNGVKMFETPVCDLAAQMRSGRAVVLAQEDLMERAMEKLSAA